MDVVQGPDGPRVAAHNAANLRASGCAVAILLVPFLALSSFFTVGGISLVLAGEWPALAFVVGSGYTQVAVVGIVWARRTLARSLDLRGTVTCRAVDRAHRITGGVRTGCFVALGVVGVIVVVVVVVGFVEERSLVGTGLMLVPAVLMVWLLLTVTWGARKLYRAYEAHYPMWSSPAREP